MILLENVSKSFQIKKTNTIIDVLNNITLHIPKGEAVGLIGSSGAGKTTFLKLLCGLIMPDLGRVRIMGLEPVRQRVELSKDISVLFADTMSINSDETIKTNLLFLKEIYNIESKLFYSRMSEFTQAFNIDNAMNEKVKNLSLGIRRKAELTALFLIPAKIILMDEPCIGLDALAKGACERIIKKLQKEGKTIIISSHTMGEIDSICSRIMMLNQGNLIYYGQKDALYHIFSPIDNMRITYKNMIPDMQDLPLLNWEIDNHELILSYNTNIISSAEIIKVIMQSSEIEEIKIIKPDLEDVVAKLYYQKKFNLDN